MMSLLFAATLASCQFTSPPQSVALVELYTSQGCSSCPPADQWLSELPRRYGPERLVPLALHVGYWDYIGWKDPFARREFNARQRWLAELAHSRTVYTPGVFVNSKEAADWRRSEGFDAAVRAINARPAAASIELTVRAADADRIEVAPRAKLLARADGGAADPRLFIALVQSGFSTAVRSGENRGETLRNDHVARDWSAALPLAGPPITLSTAAAPLSALSLVAFVQDQKTGAVLQAMQARLDVCR